jgi:hypothetical protein
MCINCNRSIIVLNKREDPDRKKILDPNPVTDPMDSDPDIASDGIHLTTYFLRKKIKVL